MKAQSRLISHLGFLLGVCLLAGCSAQERFGPFDVPGGTGSSRPDTYTAASSVPPAPSLGGEHSGTADSVAKAAAEIAASTVFFDFDKAAIRPDTAQVLDRAAALLRQYPSIRIWLHGHADARGSHEYNYGLGERRARAVYAYLIRAGVPPRQVEMVTHGKKNPALGGSTEPVFARNRRVELLIMSTCY